MDHPPVLELKNIHKSFNNVMVLEDVSLTLNPGEIMGVIGENGAGKSTMIKIICGVHDLDHGEIFFNGEKVDFRNPEESRKVGISTIYQELSLFPSLTVAQNIFIGREFDQTNISGMVTPIDNRKMEKEARRILHDTLGVDIDVNAQLEKLTMAEKQLVEIARAIYYQSNIIIMDEPTTALETKEKERLFSIIRDLKKRGTAVIFVSHYLLEVIDICDHVFVLRDGKVALNQPIAITSLDNLINAMIGKSLDKQYPKQYFEIGEPIFEVKQLSREKSFQNISFNLHEREILGIVGLAGCGKNDLIRTLFGIEKPDQGELYIRNKKVIIRDVKDAMDHKLAFLPADRKTEGNFAIKNVGWNMMIASLGLISKNTWLSNRKENKLVNSYIEKLKIKTNTSAQVISSLSGGNQQKVLLARWFLTNPDILLLEDPTRGIDVNVKTEVYKLITEFIKDGRAVIMVSSDEEEVVEICDRVIVLRNGQISADMKTSETNVEQIKKYSEKTSEQA